MRKTRFAILACLAVTAGVVVALVAAPQIASHFRKPPSMHAKWADHYETLGQMVRDVDAIVLATALSTRPGRVVSTSGGTALLPFTLVDLQVDRAVRGNLSGVITVEQTGGDAGDRALYIDGDGGPYSPGEQALLFLKQQPGTGLYYLVNPQGRFSVEGGRLNAASPDDPVAMRLDTRSVEEAFRLIRAER